MKLRFSRAAETDLAEAAAYYDAQFDGLGARLLDEVEAALRRDSPSARHLGCGAERAVYLTG